MSSSICEKPSTASDVPHGQCTLCKSSNQIKHLGWTIKAHSTISETWKMELCCSFLAASSERTSDKNKLAMAETWLQRHGNGRQPLMCINCFHKKGNVFVSQYLCDCACDGTYVSWFGLTMAAGSHSPCLIFFCNDRNYIRPDPPFVLITSIT